MAEIWGDVRAPDALAFDRRLDELAATVCPADPRTKAQRRADALSALAARATAMPCTCAFAGLSSRQTWMRPSGMSSSMCWLTPPHSAATRAAPGYVPGFGGLSAAAVRQLALSAKLRPLVHPKDCAPEPRYRPSAALADFIRCRDLTCRFPGCDRPAEYADIDHTVPWPLGPTHPSNLKLLCRIHHLLKTFYSGPNGWRDRQEPDGTVMWTSPTGHTYTTKPVGSLFFPVLAIPTGNVGVADVDAVEYREPQPHDAGPPANEGRRPRRSQPLGARNQRSPHRRAKRPERLPASRPAMSRHPFSYDPDPVSACASAKPRRRRGGRPDARVRLWFAMWEPRNCRNVRSRRFTTCGLRAPETAGGCTAAPCSAPRG